MTYQSELNELVTGFRQIQQREPNQSELNNLKLAAADATGTKIMLNTFPKSSGIARIGNGLYVKAGRR